VWRNLANRIIHIVLIILTSFLALTAIGGGIGLLTGLNAPPLVFLDGSPFSSYIIPGLALLILVGGTAAFASISLFRNHRYAWTVVVASATVVVVFEIVEVTYIGSPEGIARNLQIFYFLYGIILGILGFVFRASSRRTASSKYQ
jgi:hypothetical protein